MSWRGLGSTFTCWPGQQGDRNARQDQHHIALDTPLAMDCSHHLEPTKLDIHNCAKHCFQHQCSRLKTHTHFSRTGCRMFIKLSVSLGREEMDPQTCICKGKMPGREKGREGKRDSKYLNCDFCYLWRRLLSNFLISLKKKKKSRQQNTSCQVLTQLFRATAVNKGKFRVLLNSPSTPTANPVLGYSPPIPLS